MDFSNLNVKNIVVFGGTGAQSSPVVRHLSAAGKYTITVPTRNTSSPVALELGGLPHVHLLEANYETEAGMRASFAGQDGCYFLLNSFAMREPDEYFWTFRAYEIAVQSGLKHFVYSGANHRLRDHGYGETYRNSHNTVKAHLAEWLRHQDVRILPWTVTVGGVYAEMLEGLLRPRKQTVAVAGDQEKEVLEFAVPVGPEGSIPFFPLDDYGVNVTWAFENPGQSVGGFFEGGWYTSTFPEVAAAVTRATGREAVYRQVSINEWMEAQKPMVDPDNLMPQGFSGDAAAVFTFRRSFGAWWSVWRDNIRDAERERRNTEWARSVNPGRPRDLEEWMQRSGYTGNHREPTKMRKDLAEKMKTGKT